MRPREAGKSSGQSSIKGQIKLGLDRERDGILQLPKAETNSPLPLLLLLHGATQSADDMFEYLGSAHEEAGVAVLAPNSREQTWDAITDSFGPDVEFLNRALERVFEMVAIDATRIAVGGFSDGATYAISLGLINGDLFSRVVGFSPGFVVDGTPQAALLHLAWNARLHPANRQMRSQDRRRFEVTWVRCDLSRV